MKNMKLSWILFLAMVPLTTLAQPPEELPPPPPESAADEVVIPVPEEELPKPELVTPQPVAEPKPVPVEASKEAAFDSGMELNPSLEVYPMGYDSVNVTGAEGGRYYLGLHPAAELTSKFRTGAGREIGFTLGYDFIYREFLNKGPVMRDFENDVFGSFNINWNEMFSSDLSMLFVYFFKAGSDNSGDNAYLLDLEPSSSFKVADNLSLGLGYWFRYLVVTDVVIDPSGRNGSTEPPSDLDDVRRGSFSSDATGFDNFGSPTPFGFFPDSGIVSTAATPEQLWINHNAVALKASYTPMKGTSLKLTYRYAFNVISNDDNSEWTGHYIIPSFSQKMPWEGGNFSIGNELRMQTRKYLTNPSGEKQFRLRNRTSFTLSQSVTDFMSVKAFYRLELNDRNVEGWKLDDNHWFYLSTTFTF